VVLEVHLQGLVTINNTIRGQRGNPETGPINPRLAGQAGFSMIELLIVVIIFLIVAAAAIPTVMSSLRMAHLRGAASDYAGLLEVARSYAIRDNRYYSTYILTAGTGSPVAQAYVDMLPKVLTGASGNGGTSVATGDPTITIESDIVEETVASAPNTSNLEAQLLPSTTPVTPTDASATAPTFGPRGLPCTPNSALTGGTVCDSSGGPTAYWTFLKNTRSSTWEAVTVTPAGRIQKWYYTGSAWQKL
jgi:prepilin-type N-terminal cleavage/methylation domain-containing protein